MDILCFIVSTVMPLVTTVTGGILGPRINDLLDCTYCGCDHIQKVPIKSTNLTVKPPNNILFIYSEFIMTTPTLIINVGISTLLSLIRLPQYIDYFGIGSICEMVTNHLLQHSELNRFRSAEPYIIQMILNRTIRYFGTRS